jgi:tRNA-dihydrouridine synthase B
MTNEFDKPVGMQLYGADPDIMAEGARWAVEHGATVVDINMGCPVDKVTKRDGGSKLLTNLPGAVAMAAKCVRTLEQVSGGKVPLTCKMRLCWHDADYHAGNACSPHLARMLADVGVVGVTVHGRTTEMKFSGEVILPGIARVVEAVDGRIPVIGNGDVREPQDALRMMRATGCQGVMVGRGALSTPWIFRDIWALQVTGSVPEAPGEREKIELVRRYFDLMRTYRTEHYAMVQIRRRITWFAKRLGPCKPLKEAMRTAPGPDEVHAILDRFLRGDLRGGPVEAPADAELAA